MEPSECQKTERLLSAFVDNELDVVTSCSIQEHLETCPHCRALHAWELETQSSLKRLRDNSPTAPQSLRSRVRKRPSAPRRKVLGSATGVAAAIAILAFLAPPKPRGPEAASPMEFVQNHLSSLQRPDAVAFASSNANDTQAWLRERLRFPIKVPELAPVGYKLQGARLCHVGENSVGYLLYIPLGDAAKELVSIFIGQQGTCDGTELTETKTASNFRIRSGKCGGTSITSWDSGGLTYVAAGDIPESALAAFAEQQSIIR